MIRAGNYLMLALASAALVVAAVTLGATLNHPIIIGGGVLLILALLAWKIGSK